MSRFISGIRWWFRDSRAQQHWIRNEVTFRKMGLLARKKTAHSSLPRRSVTIEIGTEVVVTFFVKLEKTVSALFASRMVQGIFVGHHDRTGAVLRITQNGVVRDKSWTRQTLSDAWDATNWDGLCGTKWQMVAVDVDKESHS